MSVRSIEREEKGIKERNKNEIRNRRRLQ